MISHLEGLGVEASRFANPVRLPIHPHDERERGRNGKAATVAAGELF